MVGYSSVEGSWTVGSSNDAGLPLVNRAPNGNEWARARAG
jgi:hypothetical protein